MLNSAGSEEHEFHIKERLWRIQGKKLVCIRREDGGCWSFWTWRLSHSPEILLIGIVVGARFCLDSFDSILVSLFEVHCHGGSLSGLVPALHDNMIHLIK